MLTFLLGARLLLLPPAALGWLGGVGVTLAALVIGAATGVFATLRGMRLGAERSDEAAAHRLFAEAVVTADRARRRALAAETAALDPDHVASRLLLADAHEHELGEPERACALLTEAIDAIDRAIAIKRERRLSDHAETRLRARLVERVERLRGS